MGVGIQITVLGSGSAGNCALVETETTRVLVDAGLSARQIAQRLASIGRRITDIHGILLTHEHTDHIRALGVLCKANGCGVYANRLTAEAVAENPDWNGKVQISWRLFTTGQAFEIGDLTIEPLVCRMTPMIPSGSSSAITRIPSAWSLISVTPQSWLSNG